MPCTTSKCIPELTFIAIGQYAEVGAIGFGCVNGDELPNGTLGYLSQSISQKGKGLAKSTTSAGSSFEGCDGESSVGSNSTNQGEGALDSLYLITPKVDKYGRLIFDITAQSHINTSYSSSSNINLEHIQYLSEPGFPKITTSASSGGQGGSKSTQTCTYIPCDYSQCEFDNDCGYFSCSSDCKTSDSSNSSPGILLDGYGSCLNADGACSVIFRDEYGDPYPNQCESSSGSNDSTDCNFLIPCSDLVEVDSTCTSITYECNTDSNSQENSCISACGTNGPATTTSSSFSKGSKKINVTSPFTISKAKELSIQIVEALLALDESNKPRNPCGQICDVNDGKDGCWIGGAGTLTIPVSNTNSSYYSSFKLKIGMYKKDMDERKILSVKGKVYFYENDLPEDCDGETAIFNASFSFSNSKNMEINSEKDEFCSGFVIQKNNDQLQDYVGSNIVACYKIDKVTYA